MERNYLAAALAVAFVVTAAHAAVTEFVIYKEPHFKGASHVVKGEVNILEGGFAREAESLRVLGGFWKVCNGSHFTGDCRVLEAGEYPRLPPELHNRIVSIRFLGTDEKVARREGWQPKRVAVEERRELREERREARDDRREFREDRRDVREPLREAPGRVELFGQPYFNGRSISVDRAEPDLWARRFDGRASSLIIHEGRWQLCTRAGFEGRCRVLGPGEYPTLANMDDRIESLRPVS